MNDTDALDDTLRPPPAEWLEALARSEADLAAGRVVPGEVVMERLRQTIAEMEAEQRRAGPTEVAPGR